MKFCKKYQEYMQNQEKKLPGVGFKKLKKILKRCRRDSQSQKERDGALTCPSKCPLHCPGLRKYFIWFKTKQRRSHGALIEEGNDLVTYAVYNVVAIRKILKKYDKIHYSKQGQAFKSQAQRMHVEILQSPWLYELMAFHSNLKESKVETRRVCAFFEDCTLKFDGGKPSLSCSLFYSIKLDIDLTCSICLDILFDPVSLTCGHIFCYMCACSVASVSIVDGLKSAKPKSKCALCRQEGMYEGVVHLEELNLFLSQSFPKYWEQRIAKEKVERMQQVKEHWESLSRAFAGI